MPESREERAHYILFDDKFQSLKGITSFQLIGIHADASKPEEKKYNAENGHVIQLTPDCDIARGTCRSQSCIWPQKFARTQDNPDPLPINTLTLQKIHSSNRAIILDFDTYFLKVSLFIFLCISFQSQSSLIQIAYLTHTSIQFYSRKVWTESILGVSKRVSSFIFSSYLGLSIQTYGTSRIVVFMSVLLSSSKTISLPSHQMTLYFRKVLLFLPQLHTFQIFTYSRLGTRPFRS